MTKQQILDKVLKVKALAERGTEGERANAERMLKELMEKYGISDADIESEAVELFVIDVENIIYIQLLVQICNNVIGHDIKIYNLNRDDSTVVNAIEELSNRGYGDMSATHAIECTKANFIEIKMMFDLYREDLKKQIDTFMYAYFMKNSLLAKAPEDGKQKEPSKEDLEMLKKAMMMEMGIDKKEIHKMIEN